MAGSDSIASEIIADLRRQLAEAKAATSPTDLTEQRDELLAALKRSVCDEITAGTLCAECRAEAVGCARYAAIARAEGQP